MGCRGQRFLILLRKYEIVFHLVRQEVIVIEATEHWQVDLEVIMHVWTVAKEGAFEALSKSWLGRRGKKRYLDRFATRASVAQLVYALKQLVVQLMLVEEKPRWG